ncbi:AI-2E family transporter [Paenibacillus radicis (ex Gao et al. 2016)]|uniref:AI-2E family transporter n=1 Tax=Paenibacillus radicis (ex Gao et al. 2016) TaxID=1737354 RepID=A0A917HL78_9BACL|nr:AI-2E family transporter [Paenibacillus radicis (ex Gao et al. 2016)]GGG83109.1 AI-2E family transporter [Paenibacillus radicis (ex Gao et al. 2016)]
MEKLNAFIKISVAVLLVLAIIYLGSLVDFLFKPIASLVAIMTVPLMLSVFFYYLLRPLVNWMERRKLNRTLAVIIIYVMIALIFAGFVVIVWPSLRGQLLTLVENAPDLFASLSKQLEEIEQNGIWSRWFPEGGNPLSQMTDYLNKGFTFVTNYISNAVTVISSIAIVIAIFPIILFYMLKDSGKFSDRIIKLMPTRFQKDTAEVVTEIDHSLSGFIVGKVLINLALGVLMYPGFLLIGLPYALLLTAIAVILNFIPFIGSFLSMIPIVIIGFIESPSIAIWSLVVIFVAQQIQDNLIAPYVYRKQLDIHPLTTIILVLVGGDLAGMLGILLIIPVYMIIKIIVGKIYRLYIKWRWETI